MRYKVIGAFKDGSKKRADGKSGIYYVGDEYSGPHAEKYIALGLLDKNPIDPEPVVKKKKKKKKEVDEWLTQLRPE